MLFLAHMFAVLEQIQQRQQLEPQSPPSPVAPSTLQHDDFGYAVPFKNNSRKTSEPIMAVAQEYPYAVVDVTQKQTSREENTETDGNGNCSSALQSEESETDKVETQPPVAATSITAETGDKEIEPYATVKVTSVAHQKQMESTNHEHTYDEVRQPHTKMESDVTGNGTSVHEHTEIEPLYAEVTEPGIRVTTITKVDDELLVEPYATVDLPYKHNATKNHKLTHDNLKTCTPLNAGLSKLETDESDMCNKAAAVLTT